MFRLPAAALLALISIASAPAAAQAPGTPQPATAGAPDKLLYAEGGMLVLLAPGFPKEALARGETATVNVSGTIQTDGRLENVRIETTPPNASFESAVMDVVPLWRLQPRIVTTDCSATETQGRVTIWFEIDGGKPKVSYGTRPPAANAAPGIRRDRKPVHIVTPRYPRKLAENPNVPKTVMQLAYVAVAEDGAVTGVTVAPMLYYREFEPVLAAAIRQWKYAPQDRSWCGEVEFLMTLE